MTDPDAGQLPAPLAAAGTTPHGLRYPGGSDPVYNVPAYLQNLANDIDGKVQHAGNTLTRTFATWVGLLTFVKSPAAQVISLPTIRWVRGAIITRQTWSGGVAQPVLLQLSPMWTTQDPANPGYWNRLYVMAMDPLKLIDAGGGHRYADSFVGAAGVSVLAWGDPVPPGG